MVKYVYLWIKNDGVYMNCASAATNGAKSDNISLKPFDKGKNVITGDLSSNSIIFIIIQHHHQSSFNI